MAATSQPGRAVRIALHISRRLTLRKTRKSTPKATSTQSARSQGSNFLRDETFTTIHHSPVPSQAKIELIEGVTGAAKHIAHFVAHQFLHADAGRTQVFTGIELLGIVGEGLADGRGHREAKIGVDIDLGTA